MSSKGGLKFDGGKARMGLLPFLSLEQVAWVLTYGAEKYEPNSWQVVPDAIARYTDALLRHISAHQQGKILDDEGDDPTGLPHMAQAACNALFLVWLLRDQLPKTYDFRGVREKFAKKRAEAAHGGLLQATRHDYVTKTKCSICKTVKETPWLISGRGACCNDCHMRSHQLEALQR